MKTPYNRKTLRSRKKKLASRELYLRLEQNLHVVAHASDRGVTRLVI
jgi:hypothetical protein